LKSLIYRILRYINYVLIISLLLAYLSVYISPERIWLLAFFGLSYPFLLLANVLFVIFWIVKKKKFVIIPLVAILLGWNYLSSFIQIPLKINKPKTEQAISVLSYNVRLFNLYQWNENKDASDQIFKFINEQDPDVICFQEFYTKNTGELSQESILQKLDDTYYLHIDYTIENTNSNYGIATFSKYPIVNRGTIKFSNSSNASIYTDILVHDDTIRVFNNHLQSIRFNNKNYTFINNSKTLNEDERVKEIVDISSRLRDAFIKRASQAEILSKHIQNSTYPVFVCGDFNDAPVSFTYHTMKKGLSDSFVESGAGIGNTYQGNFPSFRIDFILHSKDIECFYFDIPKVKLSDHYPIIGKFQLNKL